MMLRPIKSKIIHELMQFSEAYSKPNQMTEVEIFEILSTVF